MTPLANVDTLSNTATIGNSVPQDNTVDNGPADVPVNNGPANFPVIDFGPQHADHGRAPAKGPFDVDNNEGPLDDGRDNGFDGWW